jgi:hypothetical protein
MHEYVQKSTNTTFPRSRSVVSGAELIHALMPWISGACGYVCEVVVLTPLRCASWSFAVALPSMRSCTHCAYDGTLVCRLSAQPL